MLLRITLLIALFSAMTIGGFTFGRASSQASQETGAPPDHPVVIALEAQKELKLSPEQISKLESIKAEVTAAIEPFQRKMQELEGRAKQLPQSGGDPQAVAQIQEETRSLQAQIDAQVKPKMEKLAEGVAQVLTQEQRELFMKIAKDHVAKHGSDDLVLTLIMDRRDDLNLSPQQFTKLQYLQADLIRAFAPIREQVELLQIAIRQNQQKTGHEPSQEEMQQTHQFEKQVAELKDQFSHRAIEEVLSPEQREKLHHLLQDRGGEHSAP